MVYLNWNLTHVYFLEYLHRIKFLSSSFISKYDEFVFADGTHKTNLYDLNLVVTTVNDSIGVSVLMGFLVAPSEPSQSVMKKIVLLRIFKC